MSTESYPTNRSDGSHRRGPGMRQSRAVARVGRPRAGTGPAGSIKDGMSSHTGPAYLTVGHRYMGSQREEKSSYKSSTDMYLNKGQQQVDNTYKMEPDAPFCQHTVENIISEVLEENLENSSYDGDVMGSKARILSDLIKEKIKGLNLSRFKVITWVLISERKNNSMRVASRGLWDSSWDNHATAVYENTSLHAIGTVFAVYQE